MTTDQPRNLAASLKAEARSSAPDDSCEEIRILVIFGRPGIFAWAGVETSERIAWITS
jgi:hypothetical protein